MASFVKLDGGILNSTLWSDYDARALFITALLMAEPHELIEPLPTIMVDRMEYGGWDVPAGWYGFVPAAGIGIIRRCGIGADIGMPALLRLAAPDAESRSGDFDGRRLVRVDGGFIVLNFIKYRDRDYGNAERCRRWRNRKLGTATSMSDVATSMSVVATPHVNMHAEAEADAEEERERDARSPGVDTHVATDSKAPAIVLSRRDKQRACLVSLGAIMVKDGADLLDEWLTVAKGCKEAELRSIFENARPGIQWPSDFRHERESPVR